MSVEKKPDKFLETLNRWDKKLAQWQKNLNRMADQSFKFGCQMIAAGIGCLILLIFAPLMIILLMFLFD